MNNFNIHNYYRTFSDYANKINDSRRKSEAKTLRICIKKDWKEATSITLELIEEGLLPTYEEMKQEVARHG